MVGNSPKSDINPALAAGLNAVFVPHDNTWVLEHEEVAQALPPRRLLVVETFNGLREHFERFQPVLSCPIPHQTNQNPFHHNTFPTWLLSRCSGFCAPSLAVQKNNLRRLLRTVEALSDLGPEMTAEHDFGQRARSMVTALLQAAGAREGVLFIFSDKPSLLSSIASEASR